MQREIVLDTETTGLDARKGDRLIELGCVELVNRIPTGREFHRLFNPEGREVHPDAVRIHGISSEQLADKPPFSACVDEFLDFIADAPLVIHNAAFDTGFINAELERLKRPPLETARIVDTLMLARRKHPGGPNTLDALCQRYGIDNSKRVRHGAIMDSLLLAAVYVELLGERQATLGLGAGGAGAAEAGGAGGGVRRKAKARETPLPPRLTPADEVAHRAFVATLGDKAVWNRYGKR
jgi:DNA polymerase-3 subunit epsilon